MYKKILADNDIFSVDYREISRYGKSCNRVRTYRGKTKIFHQTQYFISVVNQYYAIQDIVVNLHRAYLSLYWLRGAIDFI